MTLSVRWSSTVRAIYLTNEEQQVAVHATKSQPDQFLFVHDKLNISEVGLSELYDPTTYKWGGGASGPSEVYILQYKKKIVAIIPSGFALQKNITFIIQFCIHLMNPVLWIRIQL